MTVLDDLVSANRDYSSTFTLQPVSKDPRVALVLCMDARIDPWRAFGLHVGEAHVIRNAGGRLSDALRSIVISQTMLGTQAVAIIHHTECGMTTFTDASIRQRLREEREAIADNVAFLPFTDLEQSVRDDITLYRLSPLLRQDIELRGFIYDVNTGGLHEVEP